jgi:hypothetical protein
MNHFPASTRALLRFHAFSLMKTVTVAHAVRLLRLGFLALAFASSAPAAVCLAQPPLLIDSAFSSPQRPGVPFDHDRHAEDFDCTRCHHHYESGQNLWTPDMETRCSACHAPGDRGRLGLRQAWHGQCVGCHDQSPKAPVMCGECHIQGTTGEKP